MAAQIERLRARFRADPGDSRAFRALEEQLFLAADWAGLVEVYRARLGAPALASDPRARAQTGLRLAQVQRGRLGDADGAVECLRQALTADPRLRPALQLLRRIHTERGQWEIALQIAETESRLPMDAGEQAELEAEIALVWLDHLGDAGQAREHFERALAGGARSNAVLRGAARAFESGGDPQAAARVWEQLAAQLEGPERAVAEMALARLVGGPLADSRRALELARSALANDPRNAEAVEALAEHAESRHQWPLLADLMERRFVLATDPATRVAIALEAARVEREHLSNAAAASVWLARAGELAPDHPKIAEERAEIARARGDDAELRGHLERLVELRGDDVQLSVLIEVAALHTAAGDDSRALAHLQRAAEREPDDALVIEAVSDTLARLERWGELAAVLERRASNAEPEAAAAAWSELAALRARHLSDPQGALAAYERAFATDPAEPRAGQELARLYRALERWDELRSLLERASRSGAKAGRVRALCALGDLLLRRFEAPDEAREAYEAALGLDPRAVDVHLGLQELAARSEDPEEMIRSLEHEAEVTSEPTRLAALVGLLAPLLERAGRPEQALDWALHWRRADPEEVEAWAECARLHDRLGHDAERVEVLEKLDALLGERERGANWCQLAAHHAARGRPEAAIRAFESALGCDPSDAAALEGLVAQLERTSRFEELAGARRRLAELLPPEGRARQLDCLATLLAERLDDAGGAIEILDRLAGQPHAPADLDERIEALLERCGRWQELAVRLEQRLDASPDSEALGLRLAGLWLERIGDHEAAARSFRRVRTAHPASEAARDGLERALRAAGNPEALAAFLAEEAHGAPDGPARERAALERAILLEENLGRPETAREIYAALVSEAQAGGIVAGARARLQSLLEREGEWAALRELLESRPAAGEQEIERRLRLARLCRDRLDDRDAAVAHLEAAAALAPRRGELWRELVELLETGERSADLARALEAELESGPDRERERTLRARVAGLWAETLGDPERAREHWERLVELDPDHPEAAERLIGHWRKQGRHDAVVALLRRRLEHADPADGDRRLSLRLRLAAACGGPLGDRPAAVAELEAALAETGPRPVLAEPLCDLYDGEGRSDDALALCRRTAEAADDPLEVAYWYRRLGERLARRGEADEACVAYERALDQQPEDRATQTALRCLYRELGDLERLGRLLRAQLDQGAAEAELELRLELADLQAGPLDEPHPALMQLRRAVELAPGRRDVLDRVVALSERIAAAPEQGPEGVHGLGGPALDLVEAALSCAPQGSRRLDLEERRARLLARLPGRGDEAAAAYREVLARDPERRGARTRLGELLERDGRWEALLDSLAQEARGAAADARVDLFERAVTIAERHVSAEAALPWLERLRAERPLDPALPARLAALHREAGRWEALLRALDDEIGLRDPGAERQPLYADKARLLEEHFDSPGRAAEALECARAEQPDDARVLRQLDRLYRRCRRDRERAGVLEARVELSSDDERVRLQRELAGLYSGPLADPASAARHLLGAVAATPPESAARSELLAALGEALRATRETDAWARCAEAELAALDPGAPVFWERRRGLQRELARVYDEELRRPQAALRHWRALLDGPADRDDPSAESTRGLAEEAVLRLLRIERSWIELERRLAARLDRLDGQSRAAGADAWLELARLRDERLHDLPAAARAYRRALEGEPSSLAALRGLRSTAERLAEWGEVASTLERELEAPLEPARRGALLRRLGDVCWHRLGSTTRASRAFAAALEVDGGDRSALHSLQQLFEAMEDWRGVLGLYESEIDMLGDADPERRSAVWLRLGEIARDHTDEPERARKAYCRAADASPLEAPRRLELAELHERCGDREAFAEALGGWCDDPEAQPDARDLLHLASALEALRRPAEAAARLEQALAMDDGLAPAWDALARLREAAGDAEAAAEALVRAAACVSDTEAGARLAGAAILVEAGDPVRAAEWLREAVRRDAASASAHASLARVSEALGQREEAAAAARRVLDLRGDLERDALLAAALAGARSARDLERLEDAARFFSESLSIAPDHPEALSGYGVALAALGDLEGARRALEVRVAQQAAYPERCRHLAIVGRGLEIAGDAGAAAARYEEALAGEPGLDDVHARLVDLYESADRLDEGIAALERWAACAARPQERGQRLLRAARWELRESGREEAAARHLGAALEASPGCAEAWERLAALLEHHGRHDDALDVASRGLDTLGDPPAALARIRGRCLERRGDRREAAEAFALACRADPACADSALAAARLLRGLGEWRAAAAALERLEAHAGSDPGRSDAGIAPGKRAEVLHQLARLEAGPLEDMDTALARLRRAVALDPERRELRMALAQLLSHRPDAWREALAELGPLLDELPADVDALHMLGRAVRASGEPDRLAAVSHLLRALGIAAAEGLEEPGAHLPLRLAEPAQLDDPVHEALRQMACEASDALCAALRASEVAQPAASGDPAAAFRDASLEAAAALASPALVPLASDQVGEVLNLVAALCLDPERVHGNGDRLNEISAALGRRKRKKLRKLLDGISLDQLEAVDPEAWRRDLQALADAAAVDKMGFALRPVLRTLLDESPEPPPEGLPEGADLTAYVAVCPRARSLVRKAARACLRES